MATNVDFCEIDTSTPIKLDTIRIMIDTNIPGKEPLELKRQMIFHPTLKASSMQKMSDYPFITKDRCYQPEVSRYLNTQTYDKKISFFFSKQKQLKVFEDLNMYDSSNKVTKQTNNNESNANKIYVKNIKLMLKMLFPNSFPALNNIKDSYSMLISPDQSEDTIFSWKNMYPHFLKKGLYPDQSDQYYSYLQIDGKIYTTTQLIWLNDIFNHPKYRQLIDKYDFFIGWKSQQKNLLVNDLSKKQDKFKTDFNGTYEIKDADIKILESKKYDLKGIPKDSRSYAEKFDTNKNIDDIIKNINDIKDMLNSDKTDYAKILDSALAIRKLYKQVADKIILSKDIENKITRLITSITEINAIINIQHKFIDTNEIVLNYEAEDKATVDELKDKYPEYIEFVDLFKTFIRPKQNTTNVELQETIENFATGNKTEFDKLVQPSNNALIKAKQCTELNILQAKPSEPRFEIYVQINLIAGQLNDANQSRINCVYKSEYLGTELDHILHPSKKTWELPTKRLFFDLAELEKKGALPPPPPKKDQVMPPLPPTAAAAGGGKKTRYRTLPIYPLRKTKKTRSN